jgi:hypothetical protein
MKRAAVPPETTLHCTRCSLTIQASNLISHRQARGADGLTECERHRQAIRWETLARSHTRRGHL